jgi:hypothetical protein
MIDGVLAKHGYTVDWGFFNGVCVGAENKPLELDKALTERIIKELREDVAPRADKRAADLESGAVEPKWTMSKFIESEGGRKQWVNHVLKSGKWETVECTRAELDDYQAKCQIERAIHAAKNNAAMARSHALMLEKLIETRHGQPLIPVSNKIELNVGSRVQIGGKKGVVCEVVEIKDQVARGCGPYLNGQLLKHAILKRPDGKLIAEPTRLIRQAAIIDGAAQ